MLKLIPGVLLLIAPLTANAGADSDRELTLVAGQWHCQWQNSSDVGEQTQGMNIAEQGDFTETYDIKKMTFFTKGVVKVASAMSNGVIVTAEIEIVEQGTFVYKESLFSYTTGQIEGQLLKAMMHNSAGEQFELPAEKGNTLVDYYLNAFSSNASHYKTVDIDDAQWSFKDVDSDQIDKCYRAKDSSQFKPKTKPQFKHKDLASDVI